jgi:hypothetical protein
MAKYHVEFTIDDPDEDYVETEGKSAIEWLKSDLKDLICNVGYLDISEPEIEVI